MADVVLFGLEAGTAGPSPLAGVLAADLSGFREGLQFSPPGNLACGILSYKSWEGRLVYTRGPSLFSSGFPGSSYVFSNTSLTVSHGEFPFPASFEPLP